ncbi:MAG: hypothetical protein BGO50_15105 [Rhodanobacter sp. 67-28]|nr:MAG: hypothetical protein BGO50_15105 [Rhodanobacter sp. 67-28]
MLAENTEAPVLPETLKSVLRQSSVEVRTNSPIVLLEALAKAFVSQLATAAATAAVWLLVSSCAKCFAWVELSTMNRADEVCGLWS